ncbi:Hypothetical protein MVR_LOCUS56 [uncultured virus]|nr:Hypothetical protein MVR_LOCUS56 [uncultured virus]
MCAYYTEGVEARAGSGFYKPQKHRSLIDTCVDDSIDTPSDPFESLSIDMDENTDEHESLADSIDAEGFEGQTELDIEGLEGQGGIALYRGATHTPLFRSTHSNEKRLICFSAINKEPCNYAHHCTYAHTLDEQIIDGDKMFLYQVILDHNLKDFTTLGGFRIDSILKNLLSMTRLCENCIKGSCTGGYNCRSGVCDPFLKLCRGDLLAGGCENETVEISINTAILAKLEATDFTPCSQYIGCVNGHHLTLRGLIPYYRYIHQQEVSKKNKYQSTRYIDIDPINRVFRAHNTTDLVDSNSGESESTTDEEISAMFQGGTSMDSDWFE